MGAVAACSAAATGGLPPAAGPDGPEADLGADRTTTPIALDGSTAPEAGPWGTPSLATCVPQDTAIPPHDCAVPAVLDFGNVALGTLAMHPVVVWNSGATSRSFKLLAATVENAGAWAARLSLDLVLRSDTSEDPVSLPATMTPEDGASQPTRVWVKTTVSAAELGEVAGVVRIWTDLDATPQVDVPFVGVVVCPFGTVDLDGDPSDCEYACSATGPEVCDGADDDCDGATDEDLGSTTCGTGECERIVPSCDAGIPQTCSPGPSDTEICDGLDNDCDGATDEPSSEICDGLDNDCNGTTDDGCDCVSGATQPCGTDVGECTPGQQTCSAGVWEACDGTPPAPEVCDGLDNDCDTATDEGFSLGVPCDGGDADLCPEGLTTCAGCDDTSGGSAEACDGLDNDCDGVTDEDLGNCCTDFCCGPPKTCYKFCTTPLNWASAQTACADMGGCLLTVNDDAEASCVAASVPATFSTFWVSFKQSAGGAEPDGGWDWTCGKSPWLVWGPGEPNNSWIEEDCGERRDYGNPATLVINDIDCNGLEGFVCEMP